MNQSLKNVELNGFLNDESWNVGGDSGGDSHPECFCFGWKRIEVVPPGQPHDRKNWDFLEQVFAPWEESVGTLRNSHPAQM